ncbi:MAG TPA: hypothetical protein VHF25_05670 [Nitriliruptorales bacterium]|nr:hypothetical protein [Nitriliruptorales bacterium]
MSDASEAGVARPARASRLAVAAVAARSVGALYVLFGVLGVLGQFAGSVAGSLVGAVVVAGVLLLRWGAGIERGSTTAIYRSAWVLSLPALLDLAAVLSVAIHPLVAVRLVFEVAALLLVLLAVPVARQWRADVVGTGGSDR